MKVRKGLAIVASDVVAFATGRSPLGSNFNASDPWLHPVDADFYLDDPERHLGPFDPEGLPMQVFGEAEPVYVPSRTAAYAFVHWARWRRQGGDLHRERFLAAARWFAGFPDGRIDHAFDLAGMSAPWISGLTQGQALSIFARAELLEPGLWLAPCEPVLDWLEKPVAGGGALDRLPDGSPFIEEYPGSAHRHVLNGCLYALVGLTDRLRHGEAPRARMLLDAVLHGVERNILGWERDGWSLYELHPGPLGALPNFNTPGYQTVHIALLEHLARETGSEVLRAAASRLDQALHDPAKRMVALGGKLFYRFRSGW